MVGPVLGGLLQPLPLGLAALVGLVEREAGLGVGDQLFVEAFRKFPRLTEPAMTWSRIQGYFL